MDFLRWSCSTRDEFHLYLISDVHLEFGSSKVDSIIQQWSFQPGVKRILVIAGDLGYPMEPAYRDFLVLMRSKFDHVLVVAGNHEYYKQRTSEAIQKGYPAIKWSYTQIQDQIRQVCQEADCHFLQRGVVIIDGIRFLGTTLWTDIPPVYQTSTQFRMNDYRHMAGPKLTPITPAITTQWHREEKQWLQEEIASDSRPAIIITHHLPSYQIIANKYQGDPNNSCYASDCEELFTPPVVGWMCGHSHHRSSGSINGIPYLLNPIGYPEEDASYDLQMRVILVPKEKNTQ